MPTAINKFLFIAHFWAQGIQRRTMRKDNPALMDFLLIGGK